MLETIRELVRLTRYIYQAISWLTFILYSTIDEPSLLNFAVTDGHTVVVYISRELFFNFKKLYTTRFVDKMAEPASLYFCSGSQVSICIHYHSQLLPVGSRSSASRNLSDAAS